MGGKEGMFQWHDDGGSQSTMSRQSRHKGQWWYITAHHTIRNNQQNQKLDKATARE